MAMHLTVVGPEMAPEESHIPESAAPVNVFLLRLERLHLRLPDAFLQEMSWDYPGEAQVITGILIGRRVNVGGLYHWQRAREQISLLEFPEEMQPHGPS